MRVRTLRAAGIDDALHSCILRISSFDFAALAGAVWPIPTIQWQWIVSEADLVQISPELYFFDLEVFLQGGLA